MDPAHTPKPPQTPPAPQVVAATPVKPGVRPVVQELPHLVVGEEKRSKLGIFGIVVLSILLLGLPIGIYLVSQRTQLSPQAAVIPVVSEAVSGIFMEAKFTTGSDQAIPVDVYVKSPLDNINLVNSQIKFDPALVNIEKIATNSAELNQVGAFNKWVEVNFDNEKGSAVIIAGTPNPGVKTSGDEKLYLATMYVKPKKDGAAILQVGAGSEILRNSDSINIFKTGNDLALNFTRVNILESTPSATPRTQARSREPLLVITSPVSAQNYSYFKPLDILWSGFNVDRISQINLYVNNEKLGTVGQNIEATEAKFTWLPKETLGLHYIQPSNAYEIEVVGISEDGVVAQTRTGPFGIMGTEEVSGSVPSGASFAQNQLTITDVSRLLAGYLTEPLKDGSLDLNKDGVLNDLDLFLMKQNMLNRGVIK